MRGLISDLGARVRLTVIVDFLGDNASECLRNNGMLQNLILAVVKVLLVNLASEKNNRFEEIFGYDE